MSLLFKLLIIGVNGFIGKYVCCYFLNIGFEIIVVIWMDFFSKEI